MLEGSITFFAVRIGYVLMAFVVVNGIAAMILPFIIMLPFVIILSYVVVVDLVLTYVVVGESFVMVDAVCIVPAIFQRWL